MIEIKELLEENKDELRLWQYFPVMTTAERNELDNILFPFYIRAIEEAGKSFKSMASFIDMIFERHTGMVK